MFAQPSAVGAYVLKKNACWLPGACHFGWHRYGSLAYSILYRDVALPAQPTISHVDVLSAERMGWIAGFVAAVDWVC